MLRRLEIACWASLALLTAAVLAGHRAALAGLAGVWLAGWGRR